MRSMALMTWNLLSLLLDFFFSLLIMKSSLAIDFIVTSMPWSNNLEKELGDRRHGNKARRHSFRLLSPLAEEIMMEKLWYLVLCCAKLRPTLCDPMDCITHQAPPSMSSPGKNTGVGCHALLQEIFWTQGSNPRILHLLHTSASWVGLVI